MQLKEYQRETLQSLDRWLDTLSSAKTASEEIIQKLESVDIPPSDEQKDYPRHAWEQLKQSGHLPIEQLGIPYVQRTTDNNQPIPHICLKVPTGGGKTLLGAATTERILMQSGKNSGLLLWIVPTRAIYEQTKATLWNRQHPYRQRLERACGGRVKVLEKDDALSANDVKHHLCVMLLMLPAANRQKSKDFLRMFRNSGKYPGFFPEAGNALEEGQFQLQHPDLEREGIDNIVKQSLFNVFKLCRPIVILDEAHKAYGKKLENSQQYARAISRMDPSIVVELSATPNHHISNVLVNIQGAALQAEEMIKLPIQVETRGAAVNWQSTLELAHQRLEDLAKDTEKLEASEGRYIRPIAVVRVENTGKKQREAANIHSENIREHLISIGVQPNEIRVKSAETDELGKEDLINEHTRSPVRWIITKDALKEGWDCPFAYILVLLDNTKAKTAITQMVGRVLRMPHVKLTGTESLDRCYVICHNAEVRNTVDFVRAGLQNEGMGDISGFVNAAGANPTLKEISIRRRKQFRGERIFLPKVLHIDDSPDNWRDLDYDRDIMSEIDWNTLKIENIQPENIPAPAGGSAIIDVEGELHSIDDVQIEVDENIDISYFARRMASVIPNPWRAAQLAQQGIEKLIQNDITQKQINASRATYAEQFRKTLFTQTDELAYHIFRGKIDRKQIRFDLEATDANYEINHSYERIIDINAQSLSTPAQPVIRALFDPVLNKDFDTELERNFALYMDSIKAIRWWHRVAETQRGNYFIRGWRRDRIFPDFIAIASTHGNQPAYSDQLLIFETKGTHIKDNENTQYKQKVFKLLQDAYNGDLTPKGNMTIREGEPKGIFRIIIEDNIQQALTGTIATTPTSSLRT